MERLEDNDIIEYVLLDEEDGSVMMAADNPWKGMAEELKELLFVKGADFVDQLRHIVFWGGFRLVEGETNIFSALGEQNEDYDNLLNAARKAVEHGYRVYILPNPKGIRTADFIFERKGVYKMFDLKSIIGKSSVSNRLTESIGQTNHVILNMMTDYNARLLAKDIKMYFEANKDAREVLIMKGNKFLSVSRRFVEGRSYIKMFMKRYLR